MSYQEKRTIVSIVTGALLLAAYCIYAFGRALPQAAATDDLKFWAATILIFIGIGIAVSIVIQIIFHIVFSVAIAVREQASTGRCDEKKVEKTIEREMVQDEMNKLIEYKSMKISFAAAGVGFIAALVSLLSGSSVPVMLHIIYLSFSVGTIIEGIVQLYFYRRGVKIG